MIKTKVAFVVYGVHKDGLLDPAGTSFVDDVIIEQSKEALRSAGLDVIEYGTIIASKKEAKECLGALKKMDGLDAVVLFSGTWVWAAHLAAAVRDFSHSGKGIVLWTHPGSQGWRPVGGLVMHGALKEIGIRHRFVYGDAEKPIESGDSRQLRRKRYGPDLRSCRSFAVDEGFWS